MIWPGLAPATPEILMLPRIEMASTTLTTFPPPLAGRDTHAGPQPAVSCRRASAAVRGDAYRLALPR